MSRQSPTLLAVLVSRDERTHNEIVEKFERCARDNHEDATLSVRTLRRWIAGDVRTAPRPSQRRVARLYWGYPMAELLAPSRPEAVTATVTGDAAYDVTATFEASDTDPTRVSTSEDGIHNSTKPLAMPDDARVDHGLTPMVQSEVERHKGSHGSTYDEGKDVRRRSLLAFGGIAAAETTLRAPTRVQQALDIVTSDQAETLATACDCLTELVSYYSEQLPLSGPTEIYDDLLATRLYAGKMLDHAETSLRLRLELTVAAGRLSNLLAMAASYMGDHGTALVWCVDAERRSHESGLRDLAGWAALIRSTIAYYQGHADRSVQFAVRGQRVTPMGTPVHAKLAAQEMRARAMLAEADGMQNAWRHAGEAMSALPLDATATGVFALTRSQEPPYTATSLLLVGRFQEAATVTRSVIESSYPTQDRSRQSSAYARTLLIWG